VGEKFFNMKSYLSPDLFKTRRKADFLRIVIVPQHGLNARVTLKKGKCVGINENEFYHKVGYTCHEDPPA
jgi:hypothetical protein